MPKLDLRFIEKRLAKLEGGHKPPIQRIVVLFGDSDASEQIEILVGARIGCQIKSELPRNP